MTHASVDMVKIEAAKEALYPEEYAGTVDSRMAFDAGVRSVISQLSSPRSGTPRFEYEVRVVAADQSGYYYIRWDRAVPVTVIAESWQEAKILACTQMGDPPRGYYWAAKHKSAHMVTTS